MQFIWRMFLSEGFKITTLTKMAEIHTDWAMPKKLLKEFRDLEAACFDITAKSLACAWSVYFLLLSNSILFAITGFKLRQQHLNTTFY